MCLAPKRHSLSETPSTAQIVRSLFEGVRARQKQATHDKTPGNPGVSICSGSGA